MFLDEKDHKSEKADTKADTKTESKNCYDFAMTRIKKLVISENNSDDVYAIIHVNNHVEAINLSSARARYWLNSEYSKHINSNKLHSDDFYKTVIYHIISSAHMDGTRRAQIYHRIAQSDDGFFYDLGTPDWQFVKITKEGIETVKYDTNMPVFHRTQSLQRQVMPKEGDGKDLDRLVELLKIIPQDRHLFMVHVIALFLASCPVPIMVFEGTAGSLKTTATAAIKRIVDPNGTEKEDNVSAMSENRDDLILQLQNRYLPSFDNVGNISQPISDILCRAVTGSNNPRRKLYTNDEESIHSFKRKLVLNGIVPYLDYPDLQSRLVRYARQAVDETNRITEQEFKERFEALLPSVLGEIFVTLHKALKEYPMMKGLIKPRTRMSDFEIWGEVISRVLGYPEGEFLNRYYEKLSDDSIAAQDSHPVVSTIESFMEGKDSWEGTVSRIYLELVEIAKQHDMDPQSRHVRFPKSSNKLTKELVIVDPILKNLGFIVKTYHYTKNDGKFTKNATILSITRKSSQSTIYPHVSSPPSPPSPEGNLGTKSSEDTGEDALLCPSVPSPEITNKNAIGEYGEDGEHPPGTFRGVEFVCQTHDAGPFPVNATSMSSGSILEFHRKLGCKITYIKGENHEL
jgi:hypothetical protein